MQYLNGSTLQLRSIKNIWTTVRLILFHTPKTLRKWIGLSLPLSWMKKWDISLFGFSYLILYYVSTHTEISLLFVFLCELNPKSFRELFLIFYVWIKYPNSQLPPDILSYAVLMGFADFSNVGMSIFIPRKLFPGRCSWLHTSEWVS